jgi:hypothetical protein
MQSELERRTVGKVLRRIIPAIFTLYVISYILRRFAKEARHT